MDDGPDRKDFFISYTGVDEEWAEWIAWQLEAAGYTTVHQAWDFPASGNFVQAMHEALKNAARVIAVLSPDYLDAPYCKAEWAAAFAADPTAEKGILLPVKVRPCDLTGLHRAIVHVDIMDMDRPTARRRLLAAAGAKRAKPDEEPVFPGAAGAVGTSEPPFPGALPEVWNVPHRRNPNFTGREELLEQLHAQLCSGKPAALTQAIAGLGGVGKTQLALEFCYRHMADYDAVWWVQSEDTAQLAADYAALAVRLGLADADVQDQRALIKAARL